MEHLVSSKPELIIGLVSPIGTRLCDLSGMLRNELLRFGYQASDVRLSRLLENYTGFTEQIGDSEYARLKHLQEMGNAFRRDSDDGAAMARAAIVEIRRTRAEICGSPERPREGRAFILHQLKHPSEVELLRKVYGNRFVLIAAHAPREFRVRELARNLARKAGEPDQESKHTSSAICLVDADDKENDDFGQNTRDTVPQADLFINLAIDHFQNDVSRFIELLFGHPFRTPSTDEYAMYLARAASLRSSDENRQVGAVIVELTGNDRIRNANVISIGMNEVPRRGGGFYADNDSPDARDQHLIRWQDDDRAKEIKVSVLGELIQRMKLDGVIPDDKDGPSVLQIAGKLLPSLKGTQFMNLGEFSRPVHAEMAAIIDAARRGVAVHGRTMYVTTFPCHNCAKHIVAAGIQRVVYLEPYPKSRARSLHREEINLEFVEGTSPDERVVFSPFSGVAPRQYDQLFNMDGRGGKKGMNWKLWELSHSDRVPAHIKPNSEFVYLEGERCEIRNFTSTYQWDRDLIAPDRIQPTEESCERQSA